MFFFNPSYAVERTVFPNPEISIPHTKDYECIAGTKYEYLITPQQIIHKIDWGIIDKFVYQNIGLNFYVRYKIIHFNNTATIFNPFEFFSSLDDKNYELLSEKDKLIGIIKPNQKYIVYSKGCFNKLFMNVGSVIINIKQIHTIKENLYFSALKLFITFLVGFSIIRFVDYLSKKITRIN